MYSFPNNLPGNTSQASFKIDTKRGFYTNSSKQEISIDTDYYHGFTEWTHGKSQLVHGDHFHATRYHRNGARVVGNSPLSISASGEDKNGPWEDRRTIYMSQWLPPSVISFPPRILEDTANHRNMVLTEALNKLREEKAGWGANALQVRQTAGMIAEKTHAVLGAYRSVKRGNFVLALKHLGISKKMVRSRASNQWLQYIYGWLPLCSDIYSGVKILESHFGEESFYKTVQKSRKMSISYSSESGGFEDSWSGTYKTRVGFTATVSNSVTGAIDSFGLLNPLEVAWELLPMSFVLDWFVPVGNTLSALSATSGLDFVTGYMSNVYDIRKTTVCTDAKPISDSRFRLDSAGSLQVEAHYFERIPYSAWPRPRFYVDDTPFSTQRIGAAIALINQRL